MQYSIGNVDLDKEGTATVQIPSSFNGPFYITVKNRNHIATVTTVPVDLTNPLINYDFFDCTKQAYGDNLKLLEREYLDYILVIRTRTVLLMRWTSFQSRTEQLLFSTGYLSTDLNGDGAIDVLDLILAQNNAILFISTNHSVI